MADAPLMLHDLTNDELSPWLRSVRLTAYLLRSLASRARKALDGDEYRRNNLPEELAAAVRGEHRDGMWPESWLDRLAERWGVSLAGSADEPFALSAWLPEGRAPWLTACRVIRRTDLAALVSEWGSFLATFATSPASEDDDDILRVDLPPEIGDPWRAPIPAGAIRPHEWTAVWTFTAPLHHGADTKDGNVSRFRTEARYSPILGRSVETPIYTGNAFRGQCRDLVALNLFDTIGLRPNEAVPGWAHSLFSGGSIESGSASNGSNAAFRRELRDLLPIVDLLGGVYGNEPMDGVLRASDALPICRETADAVAHRVVPDIAAEGHDAVVDWSLRLPWAEDLYETRQLTRHAHRDLDGDGGQMLVRTQVIKAGVQWVHSVSLAAKDRLLSPLTASALAHMIDLFVRSGAVGASNARGLGAFVTDGYGTVGDPSLYREHIEKHRDDIRAVLMGARTLGPGKPTPAEKPAKGKKGAKGAHATTPEPPTEDAL
jgi:hypothetical protein